MNVINDIQKKQNELITMINTVFDEIIKEIEQLNTDENKYKTEYESIYPVTNTTGFKGKKPIAVMIGNHRIITPTWKRVVENILKEVIKDKEMKEKMLGLRDILLGRIRTRVSEKSDNMRSPIEICDGLYIETHYDTETLMNLLIEILREISYDYNDIKIVIKNKQ